MNSKICIICNELKPITEYYPHKQMGDGHLNKCKDCTKMHTKKRVEEKMKDPTFVESERARGREKSKRLGYAQKYKPSSEKKSAIMQKFREKYPEKKLAYHATVKMKPQIHGNNLHHWSYREEHRKDVIEVTRDNHSTLHRFIKYDQERMMYRTLEGILLDTRESHIEYMQKVLITLTL